MARALPTSAVLAAAEATAGCVAEAFGVPREALLGRTRRPEAAIPRMACYLLLRERFGLSWAAIGEAMRRDPATVIHGVGRCRQLARHSAALRGSLDASLAGLRATRVSQDWQPRAARFGVGFVDGRPVDADDAFRRPTDRCAQAGCGLTRAEHHAGHAASRAAA